MILPPNTRRALLQKMSASLLAGEALARAPMEAGPTEGRSLLVTPEAFGAVGDGRADDAAAIQRAIDSVVQSGGGGTVVLRPRKVYRCNSGLVLDASHISLAGNGLLDFSRWSGSYIRVTASSTGEGGHNYGRKGSISGNIRVKGAGQKSQSIGLDFSSPVEGTSAQLLVENMAISDCGTGVRFHDRAYNNLLVKCDIYSCGTCVKWEAAQDNGERNTLVGCILFNSDTAVDMSIPNAALDLVSCSLDYTTRLYNVNRGIIFASMCHHESNGWTDCPIVCHGDDALIEISGGWLLNQASHWEATNIADVGPGATLRLSSVFAHNLTLAKSGQQRVSAWARGGGDFHIADTHCFEHSPLPERVHRDRTRLSDPDFSRGSSEDLVWRIEDARTPIADRHGTIGDSLRLTSATSGDRTALRADKSGDHGVPAAFILALLPITYGQQVVTGLSVRRSPERPGGDGTVLVSGAWLRLEGYEPNGAPAVRRMEKANTAMLVPPSDAFATLAVASPRSARSAPIWATHFALVVDLARAAQASFYFTGLWCDPI